MDPQTTPGAPTSAHHHPLQPLDRAKQGPGYVYWPAIEHPSQLPANIGAVSPAVCKTCARHYYREKDGKAP